MSATMRCSKKCLAGATPGNNNNNDAENINTMNYNNNSVGHMHRPTPAVGEDLSGDAYDSSCEGLAFETGIDTYERTNWRIGSVNEALHLLGYTGVGDEDHVKAVVALLSEPLKSVDDEGTEVSLHKRFSGGMRRIVPTVTVADTHSSKTPRVTENKRKRQVSGVLMPSLAVSETQESYSRLYRPQDDNKENHRVSNCALPDSAVELEAFEQSRSSTVLVDVASSDKSSQGNAQQSFHEYCLGYVAYTTRKLSDPLTDTWKAVLGQVSKQGQEVLQTHRKSPSNDHLIVTPPDEEGKASVVMVRVLLGWRAVRFEPETIEDQARLILAFFTASSFAHLAVIKGFHRAYDLAGKANVLAVRCAIFQSFEEPVEEEIASGHEPHRPPHRVLNFKGEVECLKDEQATILNDFMADSCETQLEYCTCGSYGLVAKIKNGDQEYFLKYVSSPEVEVASVAEEGGPECHDELSNELNESAPAPEGFTWVSAAYVVRREAAAQCHFYRRIEAHRECLAREMTEADCTKHLAYVPDLFGEGTFQRQWVMDKLVSLDGRLLLVSESCGSSVSGDEFVGPEVLTPVMRSLALAHENVVDDGGVAIERGMTHGDVRPPNVLIRKHKDVDQVVLVDFGQARIEGGLFAHVLRRHCLSDSQLNAVTASGSMSPAGSPVAMGRTIHDELVNITRLKLCLLHKSLANEVKAQKSSLGLFALWGVAASSFKVPTREELTSVIELWEQYATQTLSKSVRGKLLAEAWVNLAVVAPVNLGEEWVDE